MKHRKEIIKATLDNYGGKVLAGQWNLELACGHNNMAQTRVDCTTYPHKDRFCGICWQQHLIEQEATQ